jgi:hypothetical protein
MSTHSVPMHKGSIEGIPGLQELVTTTIRAPESVALDSGSVVYTFTPDLTTEEAARFADLQTLLLSPVTLSLAERDAIRPFIAEGRDFRQLGRAAFMALSATERDRMIYDVLVGRIIVELALFRET